MFLAPIRRKPLIAVGVPVFRGDKVAYVLGAGILPERLTEILTQQRLPEDWIAVIFDSAGTIVARTHQMERFVGKEGGSGRDCADGAGDGGLHGDQIRRGYLLFFLSSAGRPTRIGRWPLESPRRILTNRTPAYRLVARRRHGDPAGEQPRVWPGRSGARSRDPSTSWRRPHWLSAPAQAVTVPSLNLREADEVGRALTRASAMLVAAQHQASHDVLTGLANRALFDEILGHQLAICRRTKTNLAIVYIDLDGFKPVNDTHGHATGDEMLCMVAARLEGRDPGIRFGGPAWRRRICAHFAAYGIGSRSDGGAEADRQSFRALFDRLADVEDIGEHRHCRVPGVGNHRRGAFAARRRSDVQSQGRRQTRRGARKLTHAAGSPSRKPHPSWVSASHSSQPDRGRSPRNLLIVAGLLDEVEWEPHGRPNHNAAKQIDGYWHIVSPTDRGLTYGRLGAKVAGGGMVREPWVKSRAHNKLATRTGI